MTDIVVLSQFSENETTYNFSKQSFVRPILDIMLKYKSVGLVDNITISLETEKNEILCNHVLSLSFMLNFDVTIHPLITEMFYRLRKQLEKTVQLEQFAIISDKFLKNIPFQLFVKLQ